MKLFTTDDTHLYVLVSRKLRAKAEGLSVAFSELPAVIKQTCEQIRPGGPLLPRKMTSHVVLVHFIRC